MFRKRENTSGSRLMLIRRRGESWVVGEPEMAGQYCYSVEHIIMHPWPLFIFADEASIADFLQSEDHTAYSLSSFVKLMRSIECQAFVMTADELAQELNGKPVRYFRSKDPVDLVLQSVKRAGKPFGDTAQGRLSVMSMQDVECAEKVYQLNEKSDNPFTSTISYWALEHLRWRSTVRKCRTVEGFMQADPISSSADNLQRFIRQRQHRQMAPIAVLLGKKSSTEVILSYGSNFANDDLGDQKVRYVMFEKAPNRNIHIDSYDHGKVGMVPHRCVPFDVLAAVA